MSGNGRAQRQGLATPARSGAAVWGAASRGKEASTASRMALASVHFFLRGMWALALGLLIALLPQAPARSAQAGEYEVKAVFLFNFSQFVDWPESAFETPGSPFVIGVLGEDPFGAILDEVVRGETVHGRPMVVRRYRSTKEIEDCHILFIARSERQALGEILADLQNRSILTVGDLDDFAARGGMITLVERTQRIRLQINLAAARRVNLAISSKLLMPAEIVG